MPDEFESEPLADDEVLLDAQASESESSDEHGADPSPAEDTTSEPASLRDVIDRVIDKSNEPVKKADPLAANEQEVEPEAPTQDQALGEQADQTDEKDVPFHNHPRFRQLIAEKNSYKEDAEQFRAISGYMNEHNLSANEVDNMFVIAAKMRSDPSEALKMLTPYVQQLQRATGAVLPDDIAQKVEFGEMSQESAEEFARARAQIDQNRQQQEFLARRAEQVSSRVAHEQIGSAVQMWEQRISASDPDYQAKSSLVYQAIRAANAESPAATPEQAVAIAEAAYKNVSEALRKIAPKRTATSTQPKAHQSTVAAKPVPKSLRDVVNMFSA